MKKYTKKEKIAFIREMITHNAEWSQRALLRIFENQTEMEKSSNETIILNGVGFTGSDANFLTSLAKSLIQYKHLTDKQMKFLYERMGKYAGQIYAFSDDEKLVAVMDKMKGVEKLVK